MDDEEEGSRHRGRHRFETRIPPRTKAIIHNFILVFGFAGLSLNSYVVYATQRGLQDPSFNPGDGQASFVVLGIWIGRVVNFFFFGYLILLLFNMRQNKVGTWVPIWLNLTILLLNCLGLEFAWRILMGEW